MEYLPEVVGRYAGVLGGADVQSFVGNVTSSSFTLYDIPDTRATYYWRVEPKNKCRTTVGPTWRFTVDPDCPPRVTNPTSRTSWRIGTSLTIRWTVCTSQCGRTVDIYALTGRDEGLIVRGTPNDGAYTFTMPRTAPTGDYRIRILDGSRTCDFYSATFRVVP